MRSPRRRSRRLMPPSFDSASEPPLPCAAEVLSPRSHGRRSEGAIVVEFNLADLLECVADTVPDHLALVCGERRLTFAEFDERATRLAHALTDRGVQAGDHVALYLYNGTEYLEAMIAAVKLRAVPINVNYRYVEEELHYLLDDADAVAVIFDPEFAPKLAAIKARLPKLRTLLSLDEYERALAGASPVRDFPARSADDLYILYTGGTTGMPKGVMWRQED